MSGQKKLVVIGGGAAGFFCAVNAARLNPALSVVIFEKTNKLLSKVKVSGGGRCNVTHACFDISSLIKKYPRGANFLKKAFQAFNPTHTIEWFEARGIKLKTEEDGRMLSITNDSQTIIDCLLREANKYGVEILLNREVKAIQTLHSIQQNKDIFKLLMASGENIEADFVVVACGGYPKTSMFDWLTSLGHIIEPPVPSLFTFNMPGNPITTLMGISVENVVVKVAGTKLVESGPLLITHWGVSGPAILKLSAWGARALADCKYNFKIMINWVPQYNEQSLRDVWQSKRYELSSTKIANRNPFALPNRLWLYLLQQSDIKEEIRWADLPGKEQNKLIKNLTAQEFQVSGKTTFKEEFVTCGGISLSEIDVNTMGSKKVSGLSFAGEIMDVDGVTGGFNFQHAWTSGWIAAKSIAASVSQHEAEPHS